MSNIDACNERGPSKCSDDCAWDVHTNSCVDKTRLCADKPRSQCMLDARCVYNASAQECVLGDCTRHTEENDCVADNTGCVWWGDKVKVEDGLIPGFCVQKNTTGESITWMIQNLPRP